MISSSRAEAIEALRQELKLAGHQMYSAASELGRSQGDDMVVRQITVALEAVRRLSTRVAELRDIELRMGKKDS